jgi:hypothetical protein
MATVRMSDGAVSVLPLLEKPVGLALYEGDTYQRIGQLNTKEWKEPGRRVGTTVTRKATVWFFDGAGYGQESGEETTAKAAKIALLAAAGYVEAPPNAANPGLFSLLDGTPQ